MLESYCIVYVDDFTLVGCPEDVQGDHFLVAFLENGNINQYLMLHSSNVNANQVRFFINVFSIALPTN